MEIRYKKNFKVRRKVMKTLDRLNVIYHNWGNANGISPLLSADDMDYDFRRGENELT